MSITERPKGKPIIPREHEPAEGLRTLGESQPGADSASRPVAPSSSETHGEARKAGKSQANAFSLSEANVRRADFSSRRTTTFLLVVSLLLGAGCFIRLAADSRVHETAFILSAFQLFASLLLAVSIVRRARRTESSLLNIEDVLRAYARGYYGRRLPENVGGELSSLARTVNLLGAGLGRHVHDLVEKHEYQRATLANMKEGLLVLDEADHVTTINRAGANMLNTEVETIQGRNIRAFGEIGNLITEVTKDGAVIEVPHIARDRERWIRARVTHLKSSAKETMGTLVELSDITDVKRFEQARQDFVANVSHELKTPITSIQGYLETLLDGESHSPQDRERFLKIVAGQADRLSSIVVELLALARLESEQGLDENALCDASIQDLLGSVKDACEVAAKAKNITIALESDTELRWKMNRWLIEQAVINLVDNSVKYGNADSVVRVIARREGRHLVISVIDESPGILSEHIPRLFERFYRIDKARTRKAGGTGLGLAIVKHIAAAHGGRVFVESEIGRGSNFTLIIPNSGSIPTQEAGQTSDISKPR